MLETGLFSWRQLIDCFTGNRLTLLIMSPIHRPHTARPGWAVQPAWRAGFVKLYSADERFAADLCELDRAIPETIRRLLSKPGSLLHVDGLTAAGDHDAVNYLELLMQIARASGLIRLKDPLRDFNGGVKLPYGIVLIHNWCESRQRAAISGNCFSPSSFEMLAGIAGPDLSTPHMSGSMTVDLGRWDLSTESPRQAKARLKKIAADHIEERINIEASAAEEDGFEYSGYQHFERNLQWLYQHVREKRHYGEIASSIKPALAGGEDDREREQRSRRVAVAVQRTAKKVGIEKES